MNFSERVKALVEVERQRRMEVARVKVELEMDDHIQREDQGVEDQQPPPHDSKPASLAVQGLVLKKRKRSVSTPLNELFVNSASPRPRNGMLSPEITDLESSCEPEAAHTAINLPEKPSLAKESFFSSGLFETFKSNHPQQPLSQQSFPQRSLPQNPPRQQPLPQKQRLQQSPLQRPLPQRPPQPKETPTLEALHKPDTSDTTSNAPSRKARSHTKAVYVSREVVDTREKPKEQPSEWYSNVDMKQKFTRGDVETLKYIKRVIKECIDASKNGGDLKRWIMELRTKIHEVEFLLVLKDIIIKKSGLLESNGLSLIFDGEDKAVFPWDIAADAEALWMRWMSGDIDPHLLRGIKTEKGVLASGKKSTTHRLEPDYSMKKSPNVFGANNLTNGQWWPSRVCALRDGAHGEQEAGIYGQTGIGAYSIVVAAGGYDDKDRGDKISYCGTKSDTSKATRSTNLLRESYRNKKPVRVLRAVNKNSKYAPKEGIRYDGLYEIIDEEILDSNTAMMRFELRRIKGQDPIRYAGDEVRPTNQELAERMKIRELLK